MADFKFLTKPEYQRIEWDTLDTDGDYGYIVECDLTYPENIRNYTQEFPLCPDNRVITYEMLSPYQQEFLRNTYRKTCYNQKKLTGTFFDREKM